MSSYVKAIYEFKGEPGSSELTIGVGEVLSVTRTDVGEGWWEGKNTKGQVGLFPEAYVEVMSAVESNRYDQPNGDGGEDDGGDDWDDDWDEENETYSEIGPGRTAADKATGSAGIPHSTSNYEHKHLPAAPRDDDAVSIGTTAGTSYGGNTTMKRSGMFGRSSDSFILGIGNRDNLRESDIVYIVHTENFYQWRPNPNVYSVMVASPKKETKFKGMKSFIAYQLTPSFNNSQVSRRYKHFDWLHERLVDKFCLIPIPPLPDKQISGRYEEQFVEHRRIQLQEFVSWVCRHPVLSQCEVWHHFLTCNDEKIWKSGKRRAERDTYVGDTYCWAITPPEKQLLQSYVDAQMDSCGLFIRTMDAAVKSLLVIANEASKRQQLQAKKEFQRIGDDLSDLAKALNIDERRTGGAMMSDSVGRVGGIFIGIGQLFGDQPKSDWIPFCDRLHIYRGILGAFPDILSTHKGAMQKRKECERLTAEQKMSATQMVDVNRRTDVISYAIMAEMSHFKAERETHLKQTLKALVEEQIKFYSNVVARLQEAHRQFD